MPELAAKLIDWIAREVAARVAAERATAAPPAAAATVEQRLFDVEQAATYLGRTPEAVRLLIHRRRVPVTKIDGKVQIDRAALDKVIADATFYHSE